MKPNLMLTIASLLSILFMTLHLTSDTVRAKAGTAEAGGSTLVAVPILVVWLYGTLVLAERQSGYIIMLVGSLLASGMPIIHVMGAGGVFRGQIAKSNPAGSSFAPLRGHRPFFPWRSISFCGSSCPSMFKDLAIAASACVSSRFENMTSEKEFRNLERTRFIEYCESSQRAMTFSVDLYSSLVGKLISPTGLVGVPYFVEMACTTSSAVSPCVASRS
jgi:hypothetical protein